MSLRLKYLPKRNEDLCLQEDSYTNVYNSFIHNSPKLEMTQLSIYRWMYQQFM